MTGAECAYYVVACSAIAAIAGLVISLKRDYDEDTRREK